jgi:hypothetical protein
MYRTVQVRAGWQNGLCLCSIYLAWTDFFWALDSARRTFCDRALVLVGSVSARMYLLHLVGHYCTHGRDVLVEVLYCVHG